MVMLDQKVYLVHVLVTVKIDRGVFPPVQITFDNFGDNKGLKEWPCHRSVLHHFRRVPFCEVGCKPGIHEIDLRGLYGTFYEVVVIGPEKIDDLGCLQYGEPALRGGRAYVHVAGN